MPELPDGYTLEKDDDGDWVLVPPEGVTIFSTPGEGLLIGVCTEDEALSDALDWLAKLPTMERVEVLDVKYHCDACDVSWTSVWCCACDDDCPECGTAIEAEDSEVLEVQRLVPGVDPCSACGSTH